MNEQDTTNGGGGEVEQEEIDDAAEALMERIGFCGCGHPEEALAFIAGGLRLLHDLKHKVWPETETYESWAARCMAHFGSDGGTYFFWYWLDKEELSEHGGSVPGWPSPAGETLLAQLTAFEALMAPGQVK